MPRAEAAPKAAVLPGVIQVKPHVDAARVVPHPPVVGIHVRKVGMAGTIAEMALFATAMLIRMKSVTVANASGTAGRRAGGSVTLRLFVVAPFLSPIPLRRRPG
jgi:hypothetical protein